LRRSKHALLQTCWRGAGGGISHWASRNAQPFVPALQRCKTNTQLASCIKLPWAA
jgi:hypothetical protein